MSQIANQLHQDGGDSDLNPDLPDCSGNAPRQFEFPLPPAELKKKGIRNPQAYDRLWAEKRREAGLWMMASSDSHTQSEPAFRGPVRIRYQWRYCYGVHPDFDNAVARCAHLHDALQDTGVLHNDNQIVAVEFDFQRVKKGHEGLLMTLLTTHEAG